MDEKKGMGKKMVRLWKEKIKNVGVQGGMECTMVLNLTCPKGSYDVNVEPGKDDVVFEDEAVLIGGWGNLIEEVYSTKTGENRGTCASRKAPAATFTNVMEATPEDLSVDEASTTRMRHQSVRSNMYDDFDLDDEDE